MGILIGGDLVPYGKNVDLFESGEVEKILGDKLLEIWNSADCRFFNLECPITDTNDKIIKCGPNIKCSTGSINGIRRLSPTCVLLSNNHILDYSEQGLIDTIDSLDKNSIKWVGVGKNIDDLNKSFSFSCHGKRIVIYNCCEHEFSIATHDSYGANPYESGTIDDEIKELKEKSDYLIVIYHGGKEHYRYPSPRLQKRCQRMIDFGAGLIICQHSHCIGCEEKYKKGTIVYGQGNFVFNLKRNEFWDTSLLIDVDVLAGYKINYIPILQSEYGTRIADKYESKVIMDSFNERSKKIKDDRFIDDEYKKYAKEELNRYLVMVNKSILTRLLYKFFPSLLEKISFNYASVLNAVECEAHNELFVEGLKEKLKTKNGMDN